MKSFFKQYKHAWILIYLAIYFPWFFALEAKIVSNCTSMYCRLDNFFPFNEWFVIPYYLWFPYVVVFVGYFLFTSKSDYYKSCAFLFIGMTICLTIYTLWPNGQNLRPDLSTLGRDNVLIHIVRALYANDTPTNVCPSIHVYNSIGIMISVCHSEKLKKIAWVKYPTLILGVLICFSTVFLKQHSVIDGLCAIVLAAVMYAIVYVPDYASIYKRRQLNKSMAN